VRRVGDEHLAQRRDAFRGRHPCVARERARQVLGVRGGGAGGARVVCF
jgi:hypothetical protein